MNITKESTIAELVAQDYRVAAVFKNKAIDFCCNGNRSIQEVCNNQSLDADQLINELTATMQQGGATNIDYNSWPLDLLADYVEKKHHRYVEKAIPEILPYLEKITRVHGSRHAELEEVLALFNEGAGELTKHMKKEELILFPYIRKMVKAEAAKTTIEAAFGTVQNPIEQMMHEHDAEGERYRKISALTNNYTVPEDGCNTYRVTLSLLKEFEDDLHLHIHLENNILFPKSILLEKQLNA
ncbi:MAG: iron-sulfur cluster repair di-iron protein [Chitinophagales bacterium]|jgi:regulator of cell morphogenesis and NO signaling